MSVAFPNSFFSPNIATLHRLTHKYNTSLRLALRHRTAPHWLCINHGYSSCQATLSAQCHAVFELVAFYWLTPATRLVRVLGCPLPETEDQDVGICNSYATTSFAL